MTSTKKVTGNKQRKQWWIYVLILIGILPTLYCVCMFFSLQGSFFIERVVTPPDPLTGDVDWRFVVKVLDGLKVYEYEFGRFYGDNTNDLRDFKAFSPNYELTVDILSKNNQTHETLLAIWGHNDNYTKVLSLVKYSQGRFESIRYDEGSSSKQIYFSAHQVLLKNVDDDAELEVILANPSVSDDQKTMTWTKRRYDYDQEKNGYFQTSVTQEPNLE